MSDEQDLSPTERAWRDLEEKGAPAAVKALVAVCDDDKAPAPAKATAGTSIFRALGFFNRSNDEKWKEPHEMTVDELRAWRRQLERDRKAAVAEMTRKDEPGNVFD